MALHDSQLFKQIHSIYKKKVKAILEISGFKTVTLLILQILSV
jgi:hypothetical protein